MRPQFKAVLIATAAMLAITACSGTRAVYQQAAASDDKAVAYAKATMLHHNALGEAAAELTTDPNVPAVTRAKIVKAYRDTVCSKAELDLTTPTEQCDEGPFYQLATATTALEATRSATTEAELTAAIELFVPLITALIASETAR